MNCITFAREIEGTQTYFNLEVSKTGRTYSLAVHCIGPSKWNIQINDQGVVANLLGSRKIVVAPFSRDYLQIEETDETATSRFWVDVKHPRYVITQQPHATPLELEERAKAFTPPDGKEVRKVYYHRSAGILVYADGDIYVLKSASEAFAKAAAFMVDQCRCPQSDSTWKVTLPGESTVHTLCFPLGRPDGSHPVLHTWDAERLEVVDL